MANKPVFLVTPRRKYHKRRRVSANACRVVSLRVIDGTGARWTFSSPVTLSADGDPCVQLRVQTATGWHTGAALWQDSPTEIACDFDCSDLDTAGGQTWEIVDPPENLDFGDTPLALPQTGTTLPADD